MNREQEKRIKSRAIKLTKIEELEITSPPIEINSQGFSILPSKSGLSRTESISPGDLKSLIDLNNKS